MSTQFPITPLVLASALLVLVPTLLEVPSTSTNPIPNNFSLFSDELLTINYFDNLTIYIYIYI